MRIIKKFLVIGSESHVGTIIAHDKAREGPRMPLIKAYKTYY